MDYAKMIDHTLLKTDAQKKDLDKLLFENDGVILEKSL